MYLFIFTSMTAYSNDVYHVIADTRQDAIKLIDLPESFIRQQLYLKLAEPCTPMIILHLEYPVESYNG